MGTHFINSTSLLLFFLYYPTILYQPGMEKFDKLSHERMKKEYPEGDWFAHFEKGDQRAFSYFFDEYYPRMFMYATLFFIREDAAEDIVIVKFHEVMKRAGSFLSSSHLVNSLYASIRHACINDKRAASYQKKELKETAYLSEDIESSFEKERELAEKLDLLHLLINKLSSDDRQILLLTIQKKSTSEIASRLNVTENNVYRKRNRAITNLLALANESQINKFF